MIVIGHYSFFAVGILLAGFFLLLLSAVVIKVGTMNVVKKFDPCFNGDRNDNGGNGYTHGLGFDNRDGRQYVDHGHLQMFSRLSQRTYAVKPKPICRDRLRVGNFNIDHLQWIDNKALIYMSRLHKFVAKEGKRVLNALTNLLKRRSKSCNTSLLVEPHKQLGTMSMVCQTKVIRTCVILCWTPCRGQN